MKAYLITIKDYGTIEGNTKKAIIAKAKRLLTDDGIQIDTCRLDHNTQLLDNAGNYSRQAMVYKIYAVKCGYGIIELVIED